VGTSGTDAKKLKIEQAAANLTSNLLWKLNDGNGYEILNIGSINLLRLIGTISSAAAGVGYSIKARV